ncbi:acyl carrier protein [Streptomyces sp. LE64]|uniref:acyl carrier protein n=1 Tax=Streptomyces sp. LE64 TaxID=3448653 RepID=UPI0040416B89
MSNNTQSSRTPSQEELEQWVLSACRDIGLGAEDADSDFFGAGGTSLTAIRLIAKAEEGFGEDALDPEDLFARSSIREIAATILRSTRT